MKAGNYCYCGKLSVGMKDGWVKALEMTFKVNVKEC